MDYATYQYLRDYCMEDLRVYIGTPEHNAALRLRIKLADGTIGKIEHEYRMALSLFQCDDLTPRERAAAHLLAVISNHRAITWQREAKPPQGNEPAPPLEKVEVDAMANQTRDAVKRYAAFLSEPERVALMADCEATLEVPPQPNEQAAQAIETVKAPAGPLDSLRAMPGLTAEELTIAFVGDKDDFRLGVNNSLEISARNCKYTVPLVLLDLVTIKGKTLNAQGAILMKMALKTVLPKDNSTSQKIRRLKGIFHDYLGIKSNPFYPKATGWKPRFKIVDKCGAADERARREAQRPSNTMSYEQMNERGNQFTSFDGFGVSEDDPGSKYLKDY